MYLKEMKMRRKSTIIWSVSIILLIAVSMIKGSAYIGDPTTAAIFEQIPAIFLAFYGFNGINPTTAVGYFAIVFTFTSIFLAFHASLTVVGIFADEEEDQTYEYLMTKPVSRSRIFLIKFLAALTMILIINLAATIGSLVSMKQYYVAGLYQDILLIQLELLFISLFFAATGLFFMAIFKQASKSTRLISMIIFSTYLISIVYDLFPKYTSLIYLTPYRFFGPKLVINNEIFIQPYIFTSIGLVVVYLWAQKNFSKKEF